MTQRYSVLRKKLKELEAELSNVVSLRPESTPIWSNPLYLEDLKQRLSFVKTLLSTEIASHPSKPRHLKLVSRRLKQLETTFHEYCWQNSFSLTSSGVDHVNHYDVGVGRSAYSCTDSCLNDDGDTASAVDGDVVDFPLPPWHKEEEEGECVEDYKELPVVVFSSDDHGMEDIAKDKGMFDEKDDVVMKKPSCSSSEEDQRRRGSGIGGVVMMCGAVAAGWVLGMVSMGLVVMSSAGFLFQLGDQYGNFLTPT